MTHLACNISVENALNSADSVRPLIAEDAQAHTIPRSCVLFSRGVVRLWSWSWLSVVVGTCFSMSVFEFKLMLLRAPRFVHSHDLAVINWQLDLLSDKFVCRMAVFSWKHFSFRGEGDEHAFKNPMNWEYRYSILAMCSLKMHHIIPLKLSYSLHFSYPEVARMHHLYEIKCKETGFWVLRK